MARRRRIRGAVRNVAIDLSPLRVSRDFRRLFLGLAVSELGYQFTLVATFIQVFELTGSPPCHGEPLPSTSASKRVTPFTAVRALGEPLPVRDAPP